MVGEVDRSLPEFDAPPLNEVVVGIQFQPANNYQQIRVFEVWQLFRQAFPVVVEQPPLPPQFETFGAGTGLPSFPFQLLSGATHDRFWFTREPQSELIQFQQDRLLHNWRKIDPKGGAYPRFENILSQFANEAKALEDYFHGLGGNERMVVTQCELSYINQIPLPAEERFRPQDWLSFVAENQSPVDEFGSSVKRVLQSRDGGRYGRLYRESGTAFDGSGRKMLVFNLTARGRPASDNLQGALEFMTLHRQMIAEEFIASTTENAHRLWKRTR
jgi:uncharacterized protein (TIGR04255 family)